MSFTDKVILITGASSGIGYATAVHLSSLGAKLAISGRNEENLLKLAAECSPHKPLIILAEMTKEEDVKEVLNKTVSTYGRLDVLVNNAGIIETGGIEETTLDQYDRVFNINVRSMYLMTMLATPHLIASKGNIVNISSVTGLRASPGVLAYCMSKSAVDQFTRCVALDLAPKGVRVNAVNPGVIVTELHKRGGMGEEDYAKFLERCQQTHALGRPGEVKEVAVAIAFLASDTSSFITGVSLPVDGGRNIMCPR